nr:uncharacterized protein LOC128698318 [Cherax quadricarinatus]
MLAQARSSGSQNSIIEEAKLTQFIPNAQGLDFLDGSSSVSQSQSGSDSSSQLVSVSDPEIQSVGEPQTVYISQPQIIESVDQSQPSETQHLKRESSSSSIQSSSSIVPGNLIATFTPPVRESRSFGNSEHSSNTLPQQPSSSVIEGNLVWSHTPKATHSCGDKEISQNSSPQQVSQTASSGGTVVEGNLVESKVYPPEQSQASGNVHLDSSVLVQQFSQELHWVIFQFRPEWWLHWIIFQLRPEWWLHWVISSSVQNGGSIESSSSSIQNGGSIGSSSSSVQNGGSIESSSSSVQNDGSIGSSSSSVQSDSSIVPGTLISSHQRFLAPQNLERGFVPNTLHQAPRGSTESSGSRDGRQTATSPVEPRTIGNNISEPGENQSLSGLLQSTFSSAASQDTLVIPLASSSPQVKTADMGSLPLGDSSSTPSFPPFPSNPEVGNSPSNTIQDLPPPLSSSVSSPQSSPL